MKAKKSQLSKIQTTPYFPNEDDIWLNSNKIFDIVDNRSDFYTNLHRSDPNWKSKTTNINRLNLNDDPDTAGIPDLSKLMHRNVSQLAEQSTNSLSKTLKKQGLAPKKKFDSLDSFALPKISTQFISIEDYFMRHLILWKILFGIDTREKIEDAVQRSNPQFDPFTGKLVKFDGWSRMSVEVKKFHMHEIGKNLLGKNYPEKVVSEASYSIVELNSTLKREWESLREHDIVFLLSFEKEISADQESENTRQKVSVDQAKADESITEQDSSKMLLEELKKPKEKDERSDWELMARMKVETVKKTNYLSGDPRKVKCKEDFMKQYGIKAIRGAEIKAHYDEDRQKIMNLDWANKQKKAGGARGSSGKGFSRHLV